MRNILSFNNTKRHPKIGLLLYRRQRKWWSFHISRVWIYAIKSFIYLSIYFFIKNVFSRKMSPFKICIKLLFHCLKGTITSRHIKQRKHKGVKITIINCVETMLMWTFQLSIFFAFWSRDRIVVKCIYIGIMLLW